MNGQNLAYIRVSSVDQNTQRQLAEVNFKFDRVFEDKCSGGTANRPQLDALKLHARAGDVIHVHSIDRLARSLKDLLELVESFKDKGVTIHFHKENLIFTADNHNATSNLMLSMLGAVAQFEKAMINERQKEGIEKAKKAGVYKGRKPNKDLHEQIINLRNEGVSIRKIAQQLECGISTVQRTIKEI